MRSIDPAWNLAGSVDYNGDGRTDLIWRHRSGGLSLWLMDGVFPIGGGTFATVDPAWQIVGSQDFDGDERADLLWRHTSGAVTMWLMNGAAVAGGGALLPVDPRWQIVASGDYNGDGLAHILWRALIGQRDALVDERYADPRGWASRRSRSSLFSRD